MTPTETSFLSQIRHDSPPPCPVAHPLPKQTGLQGRSFPSRRDTAIPPPSRVHQHQLEHQDGRKRAFAGVVITQPTDMTQYPTRGLSSVGWCPSTRLGHRLRDVIPSRKGHPVPQPGTVLVTEGATSDQDQRVLTRA